jgi:hypothetical protein
MNSKYKTFKYGLIVIFEDSPKISPLIKAINLVLFLESSIFSKNLL